jgi:signal peptidase I
VSDGSTATTEDVTESAKKHRSGLAAAAREFVLIVVGALIVSSVLRAFVGQMFIIPSESMEKTLLVGDRVVVEKLTDVNRGDVIVFEDPGNWLGPEESGEKRGSVGRFFELVGLLPDSSHGHLVKRLIGMPGDRVACCDDKGRLLVNGKPLEEKAYIFPGDAPSSIEFQVTVPAGKVFVMGDHRSASGDSRVHLQDIGPGGTNPGDAAFVPIDKITGRAIAVIWPASNLHKLGSPDTFDSVPAAAGSPPDKPSITLTPPTTPKK